MQSIYLRHYNGSVVFLLVEIFRSFKYVGLTPVHFLSHGSTMMLGEESDSANYWKKCGDEALARNIKGVVIMVALLVWLSSVYRD